MIDDPLGLSRPPPSVHGVSVKRWLRELWHLDEGADLWVSEVRCSEPGCPPVETLIVLRLDGDREVRRRLQRPLGEIDRALLAALDLPRP